MPQATVDNGPQVATAKAMAVAVAAGELGQLRQLVHENPTAVNMYGSGETTPLHVAVALRNRDAVEILASAPGADLTLKSGEPDCQTAGDLAVELGAQMIAKALRERGATFTGARAFVPQRGKPQGVKILGQAWSPEAISLVQNVIRPAVFGLLAVYGVGLDWKIVAMVTIMYSLSQKSIHNVVATAAGRPA